MADEQTTQQDVIKFGPFQESGYDELGGASPKAINVIIDEKGTVYKRPGIATYSVAPSTVIDSDGITGLYATNDSQLFAVGGNLNARSIYKIGGGASVSLSSTPNSTLVGNSRPTFTETEVFLIAAGGAAIQKVKLSTLLSTRLGGDPPRASHVAAISSRILANDVLVDKTKIRYSGISQGKIDTSGHEQWDNTGLLEDGGFFTAEARPDNIVAVRENTNEIFVWGQDNVQIFVPDPTNVFSPAATREYGCGAPYSIIKKDQEFLWLDQHKRFIYSDGRSYREIHKPIKRQLDEISDTSDAFGYRVLLGHIDCFVWTFPSAGRTFVYQDGGGWSEWLGYDSTASNFETFRVLSHYLRRDGGINVVGTIDGRVGMFSQSAYDDFGSLVVAQTTSGFLDRNSDKRKQCVCIRITGRRGENSAVSLGRIEWRDDTGGWNGPLSVDFGSTGDNYLQKEIRSLGTYRRRQWRFTFSDSANLALVRVSEEFNILSV